MQKQRKREQGIALLFSLMALLILTAIAASMIFMSGTETAINNNYRLEQRAYFAALAGVEEARQRMGTAGSLTLPTVLPSTSGGVLYILNPAGSSDVVQPWNSSNAYFDSELCHDNFYTSPANPGTGIRCTSAPTGSSWYTTTTSTEPFYNTAAALDYKWVRITFKENNTAAPYYVNGSSASGTLNAQVCLGELGQEVLLPSGQPTCITSVAATTMDPIYIVTALAVTPTGSRKMVQAEVTKPLIGPFPATLTLDGPGSTINGPSSAPFGIAGTDTSACGSMVHPAIAVDGTPASASVKRPANYTGTPPGTPPIIAGASINDISSSLPSNLSTPQALQNLLNIVTANADQIITGPASSPPLGTIANPLISVVNGDLDLGGSFTGAGLLVVTGNFSSHGNTSFTGVVIVLGGNWTSSGGGHGNFNGAFIVANIYDASHNLLPSLGPATWNWNGGGGNGMAYDQCAIDNATLSIVYRKISTHEPLY